MIIIIMIMINNDVNDKCDNDYNLIIPILLSQIYFISDENSLNIFINFI